MHFVIAGKINCSQFSYAVMIAQRLKENLPNFTYLKISKTPEDWEKWLIQICKENEWYHVKSPLIWREIGLKRGKKQFLGDINRFLDLCYDYYGIPRGVLAGDEFTKGEMDWFQSRTETTYFEEIKEEAKERREFRSRQVCITGAGTQMTEVLVMELLKIQQQSREGGLEIRLFDDLTKETRLTGSAKDAKYCPGPSGFGNCRVATNLKEALLNVDLVIVLDAFYRKPKESFVKWLKRNRNAMCALGKGLNMYAKVHCRVIIGSPSNQPNCYNANVLACFATKLHVRNIVVVTQDLGREMLKNLSSKTKVPIKDLYCPPVWGFVGLNKCIDVARTLQTHVYKVPGKRKNSTLPQGREEYEIRTVDCLLTEEDITSMHVKVAEHKADAFPRLGRMPCLAKVAAIVDLLKLWGLKQEDGNGEIICLGVYSDGTFNIPEGLYWSQPVILKNGFWVPFAEYPVPRNYQLNCYDLFIFGLAALYRTKVKPRRYYFPKAEVSPKTKKFDFDQIMKSVKMPVIRTDTDCVNYIRMLAKTDLGIDFDLIDYTLNEESEPEVVAPPEVISREEIFCECWRQELKELQKVVFYRDSTTEVEVDLSENTSGTEWSVINAKEKEPFPPDSNQNKRTSELGLQHQETNSSESTVCSCGILSDGSPCQCLGKKEFKEEDLSTEHFYMEQNAQVFVDDLNDVIYADTYTAGKQVRFDSDAETEDKTSHLPRKFYGKRDAIRDEEAEAKLKKRIMKYEKEGEECEGEEEGEEAGGEDEIRREQEEEISGEASKESLKEPKFHISIEGVPYDIIGDPEGFESLEMRRNEVDNTSTKSFREMYADKVSSPIHVIPPPVESSETPSEMNYSYGGEGNEELRSRYDECPEAFADDSLSQNESEPQNPSVESMAKALDEICSKELLMEDLRGEEYGEGYLEGEASREDIGSQITAEERKTPKIPIWKRGGIPICCLCRCILPEGLPCCPCGSTTVVEVLKKESIEIFVQSEDDMSYKIEYVERYLPPESESDLLEEPMRKVGKEKPSKDLPPESFFPFSPKVPNEFLPSKRPKELTKEYIDSLKEPVEREIPKECIQLLNRAKMKLEEEEEEEEEQTELEKRETEKKIEREEQDEKDPFDTCIPDEFFIKTDFSDLNLFTPEGVEDWRVTVQTKYREWFYQGPKFRDESYYDIAIEEISEDEFDVDKELEIYFET